MSELKSKTDNYLIKLAEQNFDNDEKFTEILKELNSRGIYDKHTQSLDTSLVGFEISNEEYIIPSCFIGLTQKIFLDQVKKVLPEWDIAVIPDDYLENSKKYSEVKIIVKNGKITREAKISTRFCDKAPSNFILLYVNISSLVCRETQNDEDKLFSKIATHFSRFFENRI